MTGRASGWSPASRTRERSERALNLVILYNIAYKPEADLARISGKSMVYRAGNSDRKARCNFR